MNVRQEIIGYIESKEVNGALLLTGKWGCGKSYVINHICEDMNEKKKEYVLVPVSLFGIDSLTMMDEAIKLKYLYAVTIVNENAAKILKGTKDAVANLLNGFSDLSNGVTGKVGSLLSVNPFSFIKISNRKKNGKDSSKRETVLILDDFERCNIAISDLLGKINEFVEVEGVKTIIVADEEKINNTENKYQEFKEKVIFKTVRLQPDYNSVISEIVNLFEETEPGYKQFIIDNLDTIRAVFQWSKSENLRILKTVLIDFERVYRVLRSLDIPDAVTIKTLYEYGIAVFEAKRSKALENDGEHKKDVDSNFEEEKIDIPMYGLKVWIKTGAWDEKYIYEEFKEAFVHEIESDEDKVLYSMIWDLNDSIIKNGLPLVMKKAYDGELSRDEIIHLIELLDILSKMNYEMPCDIDYSQIESAIKSRIKRIRDGEIREPNNHRFIDGEKLSKMNAQAQKIYRLVDHLDDNTIEWNSRQVFLKVMRKKLVTRIFSLTNYAFAEFDSDMANSFFEWYLSADNGTKRDLGRVLCRLYFRDISDINGTKENEISYKNIKSIVDKIQDIAKAENDSITKWVHTSIAISLQKRIDGE